MRLKKEDGTHRVVITGMGAISAAGVGMQALMNALLEKKVCIDPIKRFDTSLYDVHIAAEIRDFNPLEQGLSKKEARRFARFVQYAVVASDEAMSQAGFDLEREDLDRFGCVFGSGIGGLEEFSQGVETLTTRGPKKVNPLFIPTMISNMAAGNLSIRYGLRGECIELVTACATGTHCIGSAYRSIRFGMLDAALAGGAEESVTPISLAGFSNLGALTKETDPLAASMPFDKERSGFVIGEGAGALVLESLEHALGRGAKILAEVGGYGASGDAYHMTAPDPTGNGLVRSMKLALGESGFEPKDIGHINAHGTSTLMNDEAEARALQELCGDMLVSIPVVSIKGNIGHTLGAAGALEAIATVFSLDNKLVLPTAGFSRPDPACPVHILEEVKKEYPQKLALSNSLGFGGHNGTLALLPYRETE